MITRSPLLVALVALVGCQPSDTPFVDVGAASGRGATCHLDDYLAVKHPAHNGAKPTTCGVCHSEDGWHPSMLRHEWALTGAHSKADCYRCHQGNPTVFQGTRSECVACHRSDYDQSRFPGHSRFPLTCENCHTTAAWKPTLSEPPVQAAPADAVPSRPSPAAPASTPRPKPRRLVAGVPVVPTSAPRPTALPRPPSSPSPRPDNVSGASRRPAH